MPRMRMSDIAKVEGVHKSTVSRQCRAAGLVGADGLVELSDYRTLRAEGLDPALQTTGPASRAPIRSDDDLPILAAERARKLAAEAQLAELSLARQRGELLDRQATERAVEDRARSLRDRVLMVPRAIAHELALLSDTKAIEGRMRLALELALTEEHDALRGAA